MDEKKPPAIVDPTGRPARRNEDHTCPECGAQSSSRRRSSGFGAWFDICGVCGHEFPGEHLAS